LAGAVCTNALFFFTGHSSGQDHSSDLADLSIEQLMNESVTSVSKKETPLNDAPAAISVITADDIDRFGIMSIPEALRLVPGMDVARIDGDHWAISSRGFNFPFADKLLVLIDGRTVYTPASGGVFWQAQDIVLEDLDRIEVIRGPGATLWGANAVDGVINITTKSAKDTQGFMMSTAFGTEEMPTTSLRYGGRLADNVYYRVYGKFFNRDGFDTGGGDDWSAERGGFRVDWEPSHETNFTLQGDYYKSDADKLFTKIRFNPPSTILTDAEEHNTGADVLGRWTQAFSKESSLTLQTYFDHVEQSDGFALEHRDTFDIDFQHRFALANINDIVWGGGYRFTTVKSDPSPNLVWTPNVSRLHLFNLFVQDDITLVPDRLHLTLGSKFEHNSITGFEIAPSARLVWTPSDQQTVWAAVSRGTATPSLFSLKSRLNLAAFQPPFSPPIVISEFGNPNLVAEKLIAYEIGYRIRPTKQLSFDVATFYNQYDDLITATPDPTGFETDPAPPHVLISTTEHNALSGETYGAELSSQWEVMSNWRLVGSYSWLHMHLHPDPSTEQDSPQHQFQIRSYLDLPHNIELNASIAYVDTISPLAAGTRVPISSYVRGDLGIVWHPNKSIEVGVWGQNLFQDRHAEFNSIADPNQVEIPRSVMGKITVCF